MFESERDAAMRIAGTVVRYEGKSVFVEEVTGEERCRVYFPKEDETKTLNYNDPRFDYSSVPLGYVNHRGHAHYTMRQPHRRWKQGVGRDCFKVKSGERGVFNSRGMHDAVEGIYPSFDEACRLVRDEGATSVAYHRDWAIKRGDGYFRLMYKGTQVGKIVSSKPVFKTTHRFLKECYEGSQR